MMLHPRRTRRQRDRHHRRPRRHPRRHPHQPQRAARAPIYAKKMAALLKGWKMLGENCPETGDVPLMQHPTNGRKFSIATGKYTDEMTKSPPAPAPAPAVAASRPTTELLVAPLLAEVDRALRRPSRLPYNALSTIRPASTRRFFTAAAAATRGRQVCAR